MSDFEKYKHMKIEGVDKELRMLVANDNKGNKEVVWHGPDKIYGDTVQGIRSNADVNYSPDSITYKFQIYDQEGEVMDSKEMTLPEAVLKGISIDSSEESYISSEDTSNYFYPDFSCILSSEEQSEAPIIFDSTNPINTVYYSGNSFKEYKLQMPDYVLASSGISIIGLTSSTLTNERYGQGVVSEGYPFAQMTNKPPLINWAPTAVYEYKKYFNTSAMGSDVEKYYSYEEGGLQQYIGYTKRKNSDQTLNRQLTVDASCYLLAGPNARANSQSGYYYGNSDNFPANNYIIKYNQLSGIWDGRVLAYFKFDSAALEVEVNKSTPSDENHFCTTDKNYYYLHWHYVIQCSNNKTFHHAGDIKLPGSNAPRYSSQKGDGHWTQGHHIFTYTNDGTNISDFLSAANQDIEKDKWYAVILDPSYEMDTIKATNAQYNTFLCEIYDSNGNIKKEHKDIISSSVIKRSCYPYQGNYRFVVYLNDEPQYCDLTPAQFSESMSLTAGVVTLKDITKLPESAFIRTGNYIIPEDNASGKHYGQEFPICIPEMSGIKFTSF